MVPRTKERLNRDKLPVATVRRAPKPVSNSQSPRQADSAERANDLRAVSTPGNENRRQRHYREGEVLWCRLEYPIVTGGVQIDLWPGRIEQCKLNIDSDSKEDAGDADDVVMEDWDIKQWTSYQVRFFCVDHVVWVTDHEALPMQAYEPPSALIEAIEQLPRDVRSYEHVLVRDFFASNDPSTARRRFQAASGLFMLACEIVRQIGNFWMMTDDWDFKHTFDSEREMSTEAGTPAIEHNSLLSAYVAAAEQNAKEAGTAPDTSSVGSNSKVYTETRWQGLFWGGERIWAGELVRLKLARAQFVPQGAARVFPPGRPGKSVLEHIGTVTYPEGTDFTAGARSLFIQLDGIFFVQDPKSRGVRDPLISGMLCKS